MRHLNTRRWILLLAGVAVVVIAVLSPKWKASVDRGGQMPAEPFQIAGNLYYVGTNDITAFLLTGDEGHILIGDGREFVAPMIIGSIAQLGFRIADVKVLVNSHPHFDHAGALAALQQASGAQVWVSEPDADLVAAGGAGDSSLGSRKWVSYLPFARYPPPRVDHRFNDGETIRLGSLEITPHITAGHTPGSTTWSFPVRVGDRELLAVSVCDVSPPLGVSGGGPDPYMKPQTEFAQTFRTLRSLPADIFLASHGRAFGRWRKFQARDTASSPVQPFIDRAGYLSFIDEREATINTWLAKHRS